MSYRAHCDKIGLAAEHEIAAEEWLIGAAQNGLETPPLPTGQEDATRAHEIQYHEYAFCKPPPSYDVMAQVGRC